MLAKKNRLSRKEIEAIKGKKLPITQGKFFGLIFQPVAAEKKFAVIISSRVSKKAVERNRIKRQLFEAIRKTLLDQEGWFLFLAKKSSLGKSTQDFEKELLFFKEKLKKTD